MRFEISKKDLSYRILDKEGAVVFSSMNKSDIEKAKKKMQECLAHPVIVGIYGPPEKIEFVELAAGETPAVKTERTFSVKKSEMTHLKTERTCPHCGKVGRGPIMLRFHFDNCKAKKS